MKIIDEGGKEREVSGIKVITHQMTDDKGGPVTERFVEYLVHGRMHDWKDWCPLNKFKQLNPTVAV